MVLKHCFMEPLKKVQVEGCLMFAEPQDLFGNLDELCYVSYTFCRDFISLLLKDATSTNFGRTEVLVMALQRFSQLTRDGEVYHDYCLNYSKAVTYLEQLRKNDDFTTFEKWCESDRRCHRLQLTDLLISPMQHCTKVPLLLTNIRKYTEDPEERLQLTEVLEKLDSSLKNLENKMKWLKNFERVQEIQQQLIWQPITELEPRAFIPEFLKSTLMKQPCERLLASPKRQLLYEGPLTLLEINKTVNMYMLLFDDILLLTRIRQPPRKLSKTLPSPENNPTDGAIFVVHRQPIALDRFTIHDVRPPDAVGLWWEYLECGFQLMLSCDTSHYTHGTFPYLLHHGSTSTTDSMMLPSAEEASHLHESQKQYKAATRRQESVSSGSFSFDTSFSYADDINGDSAFRSCSKQTSQRDYRKKTDSSDRSESDCCNYWDKSLDDSAFFREVTLNVDDVDDLVARSMTQLNVNADRRSPDHSHSETIQNNCSSTLKDPTGSGKAPAASSSPAEPPAVNVETAPSRDPSLEADSQQPHRKDSETETETERKDISKSPAAGRHGSPLSRAQRLNLLKIIINSPVAVGKTLLPVAAGETLLPVAAGKTLLPVAAGKTLLPVAAGKTLLPVAVRRTLLPVAAGKMLSSKPSMSVCPAQHAIYAAFLPSYDVCVHHQSIRSGGNLDPKR
ncbi:hypothetical protein LSH36_188g01033 [Paralvinella palmiformis]|uniref:DH domain-containing protein n=1 Tax=Paralvinella palmiformis TaxID=53620 RepID=A0AAD9JRG5_9ANNE|nr:hypothetical protein LSH36_188g01033 [Paralvinella palmiformis]